MEYNDFPRINGGFVKGAVPKWLRERSAKPRFIGSSPIGASITFLSNHPPSQSE